ncbi:MAG: FAD-dependent oxidoreductase [Proteobacteria bacterium]|nr:FAD-dependent oxidoreductase [Pseudomonadota bacterium]
MLQTLMSPIQVGSLTLKNRIVMPAMHLGYTPTGEVTDQLVRFYERRAQGGPGLIVVGGCSVDGLGGGGWFIALKDDQYLPGLKRLAEAVRSHGVPISAQLYHAGAYSHSFLIGGQQAISSSAHVSKFTKEEAREMTHEDIQAVIQAFAAAAVRAKEAGFSSVEIIGSAGYLIPQFLSPVINKREDEYGGDFEDRARFGLEVIRAVREAVGGKFMVGMRIAGNDFVPGGGTNSEAARFAALAAEAGLDMINVTGGWHETRVPQITIDLPRLGFLYLARGVKEAVKIPVAGSNRITDLTAAEDYLKTGALDLICIGRGLIADPDLPQKAAETKLRFIRPCTACNQRCFDHVFLARPVGCMVNPLAGKEGEPALAPSAESKEVLVIGGGPAGMEAALTAARRGHRVTLVDAGRNLGGQVRWWAQPTGKTEFPRLISYFRRSLAEAGVRVLSGRRMTAEDVQDHPAEAVIVATGARPIRPDLPGVDLPHVVQAWDVLKRKVVAGKNVIVVGGGLVGLETAIYLARAGMIAPDQLYFLTVHQAETAEFVRDHLFDGLRRVTVLEMLGKIGADIGPSTKWVYFKKLKLYGISAKSSAKVVEITPEEVVYQVGDGERQSMPADTVVLAAGAAPDTALFEAIKDLPGVEVRLIGDAAQVGRIPEAIDAGFEAGNSV